MEGQMTRCILRWVVVENVIITCSTKGDIASSDWDGFCADMKKHRVNRSLGLNLGEAAMTSLQRKSASEIAKMQNIKSAIITDNSLVRGVVTALSWFGITIKGFSWAEFDEAVRFLDVPPSLEDRVKAAARTLRQRVESEMTAAHK
jgi:hypothetical protein